jgi:hypothetical protein
VCRANGLEQLLVNTMAERAHGLLLDSLLGALGQAPLRMEHVQAQAQVPAVADGSGSGSGSGSGPWAVSADHAKLLALLLHRPPPSPLPPAGGAAFPAAAAAAAGEAGVCGILTDTCRLPRSRDAALLAKLNKVHCAHPSFEQAPVSLRNEAFLVRHSAGPTVTYKVCYSIVRVSLTLRRAHRHLQGVL